MALSPLQYFMLWGSLDLSEGLSSVIEVLNYFHDYMIRILILVLVSVTYVFLYVIFSPRLDKYSLDSHILETI